MTSQNLRDAAKVLREAAQAATPGPWIVDGITDNVTGEPIVSLDLYSQSTQAPATTKPDIASDIDEAAYRASDGLSATSVKWMLRSPAHYQHMIHNRRERAAFDVGHAVHAKILGIGAELAILDFSDRRTNAYKEAEKEAREAGLTPILTKDYAPIEGMAEAVLAHPVASDLLALPGAPEVALSAIDPESGARVKCRVDYLPDHAEGYRTIPIDIKTTSDASYDGFNRSIAKYGYHLQGAMVRHLIRLVRGDETAPFTMIAVESEPPYAVAVHDVAGEYAEIAARRLRRAIDRYAECVATGEWPSYPATVHHPMPPAWLSIAEDREDQ